MALQTIKKQWFTRGVLTQRTYDLLYDSKTGDVQILLSNAPAGTAPVYRNGSWSQDAQAQGIDSGYQLFIHEEVKKEVRFAHNKAGGNSKGAVLPPYAAQSQTGVAPGTPFIPPATNPTGGSGGGLQTLDQALNDPGALYRKNASNSSKYGVGNESRLFGKSMQYPEDLLEDKQDHLIIQRYVYKPGKGDALFGNGKKNSNDISIAALNILQGKQSVTGSNLGSEKAVGTVFLPMPNSVGDSNAASWVKDEMGGLAAAVTANTMGDLKNKSGEAAFAGLVGSVLGFGGQQSASALLQGKNVMKLVQSGAISEELAQIITANVGSKLVQMQGFGVSAESILARGSGVVPNTNMELLFSGPVLREFDFAYRLSPRSDTEAAMIRRIIRFFKQGMAAKKRTGVSGAAAGFFLGTPDIFRLEYRTGNKPNNAVNKFKTCALTSFSCNYTADNFWAAYQDGQPVSMSMAFRFQELEPLYDTDYQVGVSPDRQDLRSISDDSVGY